MIAPRLLAALGEAISPRYLPDISSISPRYLPYISPISPLYLPYISQVLAGEISKLGLPPQ